MKDRYFLDTNILVYAHDSQSSEKREISQKLIFEGIRSGLGTISSQVISEYYVTMDKKFKLPYSNILHIIHQLGSLSNIEITYAMTVRSIERHKAHTISYWDSLIIEAALQDGCTTLYSEDMNNERIIDGIRIINPYKALDQEQTL